MERSGFGLTDYVVFSLSLCTCAGIGLFYAIRGWRKSSNEEFLMGSRNMKVIPLTISLAVSVISAVTILGLPAEMYTQGTQYFFNFGSGLGIVLTAIIFVPLLHPLKLTSMFEYLEQRYQSQAVRMTGSVLEILALVLYGGAALYAPAVALAGVTPFPVWQYVILLGALVTFYTTLGGMKAVVWSDVVQLVIMVAGILTVMIQGCIAVGGIKEVFRLNSQGDRLHSYNFDPDPTTRHTFWGLSMGFGMGSLSFYGASQFTFQRYTAVKSLRDARMTVLLNLPLFYMFHVMLCFVGLIIFAYYSKIGCDPILNKSIAHSNQLLPAFVMSTLGHIPGLCGLFVAALTGGALSTLSSVINSVATLIWGDVLKQWFTNLSDQKATLANKLAMIACGAVIVGLSFIADSFGPHIFQVSFALLGASGGPQLGLFLLGSLVPWSNGKGAISGCLAGLALTSWITVGSYITKPFTPPLPPAPSNSCLANHTGYFILHTNGAEVNGSYSGGYEIAVNKSLLNMYKDDTLTTTHPPDSGSHQVYGLDKLYSVSYTWYTMIGSMTCVVVGCLVSLATGGMENKVESHLVLPWWKGIQYIHIKVKRCCGINPDTEEALSKMYKIEYRDPSSGEVELSLMANEKNGTAI